MSLCCHVTAFVTASKASRFGSNRRGIMPKNKANNNNTISPTNNMTNNKRGPSPQNSVENNNK